MVRAFPVVRFFMPLLRQYLYLLYLSLSFELKFLNWFIIEVQSITVSVILKYTHSYLN